MSLRLPLPLRLGGLAVVFAIAIALAGAAHGADPVATVRVAFDRDGITDIGVHGLATSPPDARSAPAIRCGSRRSPSWWSPSA